MILLRSSHIRYVARWLSVPPGKFSLNKPIP